MKSNNDDYDKELAKYQALIKPPTIKFTGKARRRSEKGVAKYATQCHGPRYVFSTSWYQPCSSTIESVFIDPSKQHSLTKVTRCPRCKTLWAMNIFYDPSGNGKAKLAFSALAMEFSPKALEFFDKGYKWKEVVT